MAPLARTRRSGAPLRSLGGAAPREISLVGSAMGSPAAAEPRCAHCHRTPLVGEVVHVYLAAGGDRTVCALCRSRHREPPARSEIVHSPEHHRAVKARTRAA
jgi:hypothetical protein